MKYFKSDEEAIGIFVKLFEECLKDPELSEGIKKVNQLILFDYTQSGPNCCFYLDSRGGQAKVGAGKPPEPPDLTMSLDCDDAHLSWQDKFNPVMGITRGKIKVKGVATGLLKLAPKLKKVAVIYKELLKREGMADKIV